MKRSCFLFIAVLLFSSTSFSSTMTCMICNGSGQVPIIIGCDMFYNPVWGWGMCSACGGTGQVYVSDYPVYPTYNSYPSVPVSTSNTGENSSSYTCRSCKGNGKCSSCNGTGRKYDYGVYSIVTDEKYEQRCGVCNGTGKCCGCNGKGVY